MNKFERVFKAFQRSYNLVPLEVFGNDPYRTLVSTILSSRTRDETTLKASKRLFRMAPTIKGLRQLGSEAIEQLIFPVGFYKTKARHLKKLGKIILKDFNGKIPATRTDLVKLPGVGKKTANLVLNRAFGKPAIAVDTHVHRISNLLGWVHTKTPEQTEKELTKVLPRKYWPNINRLFVSIGRQYRSKEKIKKFLERNNLV